MSSPSDFPTRLFINGELRSGKEGHTLPQTNPATGELFCEVSAAGVVEVDAALEGAQHAFESGWRDLAPGKGTGILHNVAEVIRDHLEWLAQLEIRNIGKPISDARDETLLCA